MLTITGSDYPIDDPCKVGTKPPRNTKGWLWLDTRSGRVKKWRGRHWKAVGRFTRHEITTLGQGEFLVSDPEPHRFYNFVLPAPTEFDFGKAVVIDEVKFYAHKRSQPEN